MSSVAIITARGGSKRIPRKNIKDFLGKPIIAYSIEAALSSGVFGVIPFEKLVGSKTAGTLYSFNVSMTSL